MKTHRILFATLLLTACMAFAEEPSIAWKIAKIDSGAWRDPRPVDVTRVQALLRDLSAAYQVEELTVADKAITATHTLLRDRYGIEQPIQQTLEDMRRRHPSGNTAAAIDRDFVAYVQFRHQNP